MRQEAQRHFETTFFETISKNIRNFLANLFFFQVTCHNARYGEGREFYSQEMNYLTDHSAEEWLQLLPREHSLEFYNRGYSPSSKYNQINCDKMSVDDLPKKYPS